jgi:four helix bundle protein
VERKKEKMETHRDRPFDICERTFRFSLGIVRFCKSLESSRSDVYRTLGRQLLRAGTSIGANAEEAQGAQSRPDFISKNNIALKEARETHYWLRLLCAESAGTNGEADRLRDEADELKRIFGAIVANARRADADTAERGS